MRVNISIPDALHERVERVRDRVNVSRVCTTALEREVDMLEARPSVAEQKIAQLVERLKGSSQRWYDRGHEDGMQWGTEKARRADLQAASDVFRLYDGRQLAQPYLEEKMTEDMPPGLPGLTALDDKETPWVLRDLGIDSEPTYNSDSDLRARFQAAYADVDDAAYLEGWRDALVELWDAVAPALR